MTSGTFALNGGGTATTGGLFSIAAGATLNFGGSYTLNATSSVSGAGGVNFSSGTTNVAGTYNITGTSTFSGATVNFNAPITSLGAGPLTISSGAVNFNSTTPTVTDINLSGGTLGGSATLNASGNLTWTGGSMVGTGTTSVAGAGSTISGNAQRGLDRVLNNSGTITDSRGDSIILYFGLNSGATPSVLNNTGTYNVTAGGEFNQNVGNAGDAINNSGVWNVSGAGTVSNVNAGIAFNNTGTVNVTSGTFALNGTTVTQYSSNTLTGGTWRVFASSVLNLPTTGTGIVTNQADITLSGSGSIFRAGGASATLDSQLTTNSGALRLLAGRNYTAPGTFTSSGVLELGGITFTAPTLVNTATGIIFGFGTVSIRPTNSGLIRSAGGTLAFSNGILGGSGTVQVDAGSVLDLSGGAVGSSADFLIHNGTTAGSLNLGANTFTVGVDYTNGSFGTGNTFNPRANVAGAGQILATGGIAQALTGNVTGGTTLTPSLASFGNVHVGDVVTKNYRIANVGATGPILRGAIQTSVNGGNLTDARLTGAGVTASNFGPIAPGADSGDLAVTFNATSAGSLTGQAVRLINNFDNVAEQLLSISGAAYRFASPSAHTPEPVNFGNRHVGDIAPSQALTLANTAANDTFSERLNAAFGTLTGGVTASGSFNLLAPGATDSTSLAVGFSTATVGNKGGTAIILLTSDGTGTSGLGTTALASQTVTVNGSVFRLANASAHLPEPVNLGNRHVGDTAPSQAITLTNTAASDTFSEKLSAAFGTLTGGVTASGFFNLLAPTATDSTSLAVGYSTATVGNKSGTAIILLTSDGTGTSGLGTTALASQTVNVSGSVFRLASASAHTPEPVNLGNRHVGDLAPSQALTLANTAVNDGFSEKLNAGFGTLTGGVTASGSFALLAPGATDSTNLKVGYSTATAGNKGGTAIIQLTSDGTGTSDLIATVLASQIVNMSGSVFRLAGASAHTPEPINFGNRHVGDIAPSQAITLSNTAANDTFSEKLNAAFGTLTGGVTAGGTFNLLAPTATDSTSLTVGYSTATVGNKSGTAIILLTSDGTGTSGLGTTALTSQTVNVNGSVFRFASASAHTPEPINFGNRHVGDIAPNQAITLTNSAANDSFSEKLNAAFGTLTGGVTASGSFNLLAPTVTDSTSLAVGFSTATAGNKSGTAAIQLTSDGIGTSGLGTTALTSQTVNVSGSVFRLASASAHTPEPVNFGIVHVGDTASAPLSVTNNAVIDGFSERLSGSISGQTGAAGGAGSFNLLASGASSPALSVNISTLTAGAKSGTVTLGFLSDGAGTSGLGTTALTSQTVNVSGQVNNFAGALYTFGSGPGTLTGGGTSYSLDFGTLNQGGPARHVTLSLANGAAAPADSLAGSFTLAAGNFQLANFSTFTGLLAGQSLSTLAIDFTPNSLGNFTGTATLAPRSQNTGGFDGALSSVTLNFTAMVVPVPEPQSAMLLGLASLLLGLRRRRVASGQP